MARINPAAELAVRCVTRLEELSRAGDDYPIPLDRLVASQAGELPADVQAKALKHAVFKQRIVFGHARRPDAPVVLTGDVDRLTASRVYFEFVCGLSIENGPPWNLAELKKLVPKPLVASFERAVRDRAAAGDSTIALTHDDWLRLRLLAALETSGGAAGASPRSLRSVAEQAGCQPLKNAAKLKKIVAGPAFAQRAATLLDKTLDTSVVPIAAARQLASHPASLATLLTAARTDKKRLLTVRELLKKASAAIRPFIQEHVAERLTAGGSLGAVGAIRDGKEYKLFLVQDVEPAALRQRLLHGDLAERDPAAAQRNTERTESRDASLTHDAVSNATLAPSDLAVSPVAPVACVSPVAPVAPVARGDFATEFHAVFQRLDAASGQRNQVSLVPLRTALSAWSRDEFDAELQRLRVAGQYALSGLQSRGGITPEEQAAGIREAGLLRIYVSRRN